MRGCPVVVPWLSRGAALLRWCALAVLAMRVLIVGVALDIQAVFVCWDNQRLASGYSLNISVYSLRISVNPWLSRGCPVAHQL